jgi:hypothetical protein
VFGDELAHPHPGVEPLRGNVDKFLAGRDLDLDVGIGCRERGEDRADDERHD